MPKSSAPKTPASRLEPLPAWSRGVLQPGIEFGPVELPLLSGQIPDALQGTLYRNGPARLERGKTRVGHWFDGDGAVLGVKFQDGRAIATYRYVQTAEYQAEEKAGKFLYGGYGRRPVGNPWRRITKPVKNVANTSVLVAGDRLLALWEGGLPHALDLDSLATLGIDDYLAGALKNQAYSAHPKRDPQTGEIFNFGVSPGRESLLHLYRSHSNGVIQRQKAIPLNGLPLIHDFVLAGRYLVFCISPVRAKLWPILLQQQSFSDAAQWQPELGTEILVCDRDTLEPVKRFQTDPWFQWHFGNGYESDDGLVTIEYIRYPDFQTNQRLKEVASGRIHTVAHGQLWHLCLNPQTGTVVQQKSVCDRPGEFPIVLPQDVGQRHRYSYLCVRRSADSRKDDELFGAIARIDHENQTLIEVDCGAGFYTTEPIATPEGWILTVVYNSHAHRSEVWIYTNDRLGQGAIARLALPQVVPISFHGTWHAASR